LIISSFGPVPSGAAGYGLLTWRRNGSPDGPGVSLRRVAWGWPAGDPYAMNRKRRPEAARVPTRVLRRFEPIAADEWKRMDNNAKAAYGKALFLEQPDTVDGSAAAVAGWLSGLGVETPAAAQRDLHRAVERRPEAEALAACVAGPEANPERSLSGWAGHAD
jgi:hypothetical protein